MWNDIREVSKYKSTIYQEQTEALPSFNAVFTFRQNKQVTQQSVVQGFKLMVVEKFIQMPHHTDSAL